MEHLLKPYLLKFKSHHLPLPKSLIKLYHPTFSPQSYVATLHDSNKYYCQIILIYHDNYLYQLQNIDKRIRYNKCKFIAEFKGFSIQHEKSTSKMYIYYEMGIRTFKGIFKSYSSKEEAFWRMFFPLVRALAFLQKEKLSHGSLNRYNIILTQSHQIKLLYNINQPTSIQLYNQDSSNSDWQYLFLSPQQMNCDSVQQIDMFKSDVFNLGIIFLVHLISIKEGDYGDDHYLDKQIGILKQKYSYCLCNVLSKMVDMDQWKRPRWFEIGLMLDELEREMEEEKRDESDLYTDVAPRMSRDLLSTADLKETRRTRVSQFSYD